MANRFNNLKSAVSYMETKLRMVIEDAMLEVIEKHIIPTMLKNIDDVVYGAYKPTGKNPYVRRGVTNGLLDPKNIKYDITFRGNVVVVNVQNLAEVSGKVFAQNGYRYRLDQLIVDGQANWIHSEWYKIRHSRDFYQETVDEMSSELPGLISSAFKKRGLSLQFKVHWY